MRTLLLNLTVICAGALLAATANAQTHNYINSMRSSTDKNVFVQQSVEGEYGKYAAEGSMTLADGSKAPLATSQFWKGYGIGTTIGMEMIKFVQVVAGHTFVTMRYRDDALESLSGSRLNAGLRFSFLAPIGNLEIGGGLLGSRLDYQKQLENASFYGSGQYYSVGLNYFVNSRVSVYFEAKMHQEHLVRNGGSSTVSAMDSNSTLMGGGFRIWL